MTFNSSGQWTCTEEGKGEQTGVPEKKKKHDSQPDSPNRHHILEVKIDLSLRRSNVCPTILVATSPFGQSAPALTMRSPLLTSRQKTDISAHLGEVDVTTCAQTLGSICTASKRFTVVFGNSTATCFVYTTMVLGQSAGLSKEACSFASADWLSSSVSQRVARGQS